MTNYILVKFSCNYELRYWLFFTARIQLKYTMKYWENKKQIRSHLKLRKLEAKNLKSKNKISLART
jgi:hypothetical protein